MQLLKPTWQHIRSKAGLFIANWLCAVDGVGEDAEAAEVAALGQ
jgi:hypothetical protein